MARLAYFREYSTALFHEFRLLFKVHRERGFSIIQACNPPDLVFLAALPFKLIGKRFIYDQHDVSPELFIVKFGKKGLLYRALMVFERLSYMTADHVITANATFKDIADKPRRQNAFASRGRVRSARPQAHPSRRA